MADNLKAVENGLHQLVYQTVQEGLLDGQFMQLLQLQDESNPDFVQELIVLYFEDGASKLERLEARLAEPNPDFNDIDQIVHQFKGSSASFGAGSIARICVELRDRCHAADRGSCSDLLNQIKQHFAVLKSRLDMYTELETRKKKLSQGGGNHHS